MTHSAILIGSLFLLVAFAIERFSQTAKLPSVIVMLLAGFIAKPVINYFGYQLNDLDSIVPILGTIGLILIVLEGACDIKLSRDRLGLAASAFTIATLGIALCLLLMVIAAVGLLGMNIFKAMLLAIPFALISSAVAIPSSQFLPSDEKTFIVYESSISDILGILLFFAMLNSNGTFTGMLTAFVGGGLLSLLLSFIFALVLVLILMRIENNIRFAPILAGLFGLYALGKILHLSPLILVLFFGLALNNSKMFTRFPWIRSRVSPRHGKTVKEFKTMVLELTFAVRGFFFILLGYWTRLSDLLSPTAWLAAILILSFTYSSRYLLLKASRHNMADTLTWIAPRGLITILLFLTAGEAMPLPEFMKGAVVIVVIFSSALISLAHWRSSEATEEVPETNTDIAIMKNPPVVTQEV